MSFSFVATGTRDEVVASLDGLTPAQLGNDNLGSNIRDALVEAISVGTDMAEPSDQRYQVDVFGHAGHSSVVTLNAVVKLVPAPPATQDTPPEATSSTG